MAFSTYTENALVVYDQKVIPGEPYLPTYSVSTITLVSAATANSHIVQIMAGSSLNVRIRHFKVQVVVSVGASVDILGLYRLSSAGTGGTVLTPAPYDPADTSGATAMTLPSAKGTETTLVQSQAVSFPALGSVSTTYFWEWTQQPNGKPIIIPAGTSNGLAWKNVTAEASGTMLFYVEFVETSY